MNHIGQLNETAHCSHTTGFTPDKHKGINLFNKTLPALRWWASEHNWVRMLFLGQQQIQPTVRFHIYSFKNWQNCLNAIFQSPVFTLLSINDRPVIKLCCRGKHKQMYITNRSFKEEFFWKENTEFSTLVPEGAEIKRVIVRLRSHWYADSHESSAVPVASCKFIYWILWNFTA